jgi:V/A-type H+-transporting ATPase subunit I
MEIDPGDIKRARLVRMVFGEIAGSLEMGHTERPFMVVKSGRYVVGVAMPQNADQMLEVLRGYNFNDKTPKISGASFEDLKVRESALRCRLKILDRYTDDFQRSAGRSLKQIFYSYKEYEQIYKAMRLSKASEKILFITGWIDARDKGKLVSILREICGERFVVVDRRDPEAPVRLMNIRLFKPFELIVRTMGMPANSEIDPTPLSAMTFVLFFGLMFGDVGQGLVLAIAGLVLKSIGQKRQRENMDQAGSILSVCGLSSAFCGVLYGRLFSSDHLIPAIWIDPAENIMDLFPVTILLGGAIIVMGLFINVINAIINADYAEALLGKRGMAVLILYGAILFLSLRYTSNREVPEHWEIGIFILLPLLIFSLRGVLGPVLFKGKRPHDLVGYLAETIMDIVEITLSLFVNTISFIRVGAFALSHAGLGIVTFTLAGMADPALNSPAAIAILVLGNIFILAFEGLVVAIQSLRLEYYEFFSKFFKGSGLVFSPFVLKTKMSEV